MKQQVEKIFNDLEEYHHFCRWELREFNPAHLYKKSNWNWRAFLNYKNGFKKRPNVNKHKHNNNNYNKR